MSTPPIPTAEQITATRGRLWHQSGDPILTVDGLRSWLNRAGFALFAPRPQQLACPTPTIIEAVLGASNQAPASGEIEQARTITARLVAEGAAVPLNLLGVSGATSDTPDFLCSTQAFSYIFTLRGDKAWKQPPATSGAVKVSPLALAAYELLAAPAALSASELASELGKEVTEAAVLRALNELWSHLRVIPVAQPDGPVLWELSVSRFAKQIKAGSNAGQPTALSALISLYLGMAVVAGEEEIETILSPLAPRSRIRDVIHALTGARELETIAVGGRTVVHVAGDLPAFGSADPAPEPAAPETIEVESLDASSSEDGPSSRITKFVPKPRKTGTGFAKSFKPRPAAARPTERERRPFQKRPATGSFEGSASGPAEPRPFESRPDRPTFRRNGKRPAEQGGTRPTQRRNGGWSPAPQSDAESNAPRPTRKHFSKSKPFTPRRDDAPARPYPRENSESFSRKPRFPRSEQTPRKPFTGPAEAGTDAPRKTFRKFDAPRFPKSPAPRAQNETSSEPRQRPYGKAAGFPGKKTFSRPFDRSPGAKFPGKKSAGDKPYGEKRFGTKPAGSKFGAPKPFGSKPFRARPTGDSPSGPRPPRPFAKFTDGKKPFRKSGTSGKRFGAPPSGPTGAFRKRKPEDEA